MVSILQSGFYPQHTIEIALLQLTNDCLISQSFWAFIFLDISFWNWLSFLLETLLLGFGDTAVPYFFSSINCSSFHSIHGLFPPTFQNKALPKAHPLLLASPSLIIFPSMPPLCEWSIRFWGASLTWLGSWHWLLATGCGFSPHGPLHEAACVVSWHGSWLPPEWDTQEAKMEAATPFMN